MGRRYATTTGEPAHVEAGRLPRRHRTAPRRGTQPRLRSDLRGAVSRATASAVALLAITASPAATAAAVPTIDLTDATATSDLTLRATPSPRSAPVGSVASGEHVKITGGHEGSFSEVTTPGGTTGWVLTGYLDDAIELPDSRARRYVAADGLDLVVHTTVTPLAARKPHDGANDKPSSAKAAETEKAADLPQHLVVQVAGEPEGELTPVIWDGGIGWVASSGLADSYSDSFKKESPAKQAKPARKAPRIPKDLGSKSLNRLEKPAKLAVVAAREKFPNAKSIGGWRPTGASYIGKASDHDEGLAIDIMVPKYNTKAGRRFGDRVAKWAIAHADELDIDYVLWRQRNYRLSRGHWVRMPNRGSATQNHFDHVHISFKG